MNGKIIEKNIMLLKVYVGEATVGENEYTLSTAVSGCPLVYSEKTGKSFMLSWEEIIDMAINAGVDEGE